MKARMGQIEKNGSATKIELNEIRAWLNGSNQPVPYALNASRNRWITTSIVKNQIHHFNERLIWRCARHARYANDGATIAANKNECVKPRCASKSLTGSSQKEATKSISGKLCIAAPNKRALLPRCLPTSTSPIQAPTAIWVNVSK